MTYDEIKTKVAEYLNRTDLTSQMDMFIDLTESDINKVIKHQDLIKRANAVAETQYTQLPSDWSRVINVELNTSDHTTLLQQSTESLDLKRTSIDNVSGRPEYFAITDNAIELCPTPDTNYELQLTYYANIPELSSTNTTNVVLIYFSILTDLDNQQKIFSNQID